MSEVPPIPPVPPSSPMQPPPIPYATSQDDTNPEARNWAMVCHLASLSGYLTGLGFILGPLIVWAIKKDQHPFVDFHGREAMNFNISFTIYSIVAVILVFACVGFFLLPVVGVVWLVFTIIAAIKANSGERYRYPLTIRFF